MLTSLATSTHPPITFVVRQSAHFSVAPHYVHELAVQNIVRCLKGTSTKGYILNATTFTLLIVMWILVLVGSGNLPMLLIPYS